MVSLSFRKRDIITLVVLVGVAIVIPSLANARNIPLTPVPFVSLVIMALSVLIDAYYNSYREKRELELSVYERAAPLAALHNQLTNEVEVARKELEIIRAESEGIKAINAIGQLDRETTVALLRTLSKPKKFEVWLNRAISFFLGVAGSMLASYLYALI